MVAELQSAAFPLGYTVKYQLPLKDSNFHCRLQRPVSCLLDDCTNYVRAGNMFNDSGGDRTRTLRCDRPVL